LIRAEASTSDKNGGTEMLTQSELTKEELQREFARMQRAQFIIWLATKDEAILRELAEAKEQMDMGKSTTWNQVRLELNQKHGV
jgi:hypothetical protein